MAAPNRIGNLTFSYNRTSSAFNSDTRGENVSKRFTNVNKEISSASTSSKESTLQNGETENPKSLIKNKKNGKILSFSVPLTTEAAIRSSIPTHEEGVWVESKKKVQRSHSKKIIRDCNNLQSLFALAKSNENLNEAGEDNISHHQQHSTTESLDDQLSKAFQRGRTRSSNDLLSSEGNEHANVNVERYNDLQTSDFSASKVSRSASSTETRKYNQQVENVERRSVATSLMITNDENYRANTLNENEESYGERLEEDKRYDHRKYSAINRLAEENPNKRSEVRSRSNSLLGNDCDVTLDETKSSPNRRDVLRNTQIVPGNTQNVPRNTPNVNGSLPEQGIDQFDIMKDTSFINIKKSKSFAFGSAASKETRALKGIGGILLSSDNDRITTCNDCHQTDERGRRSKETNQHPSSDSFIPVSVRQRSRSIDELMDCPPEYSHHEYNNETTETKIVAMDVNTNFSSMHMNYSEGEKIKRTTRCQNVTYSIPDNASLREEKEKNITSENLKKHFLNLSVREVPTSNAVKEFQQQKQQQNQESFSWTASTTNTNQKTRSSRKSYTKESINSNVDNPAKTWTASKSYGKKADNLLTAQNRRTLNQRASNMEFGQFGLVNYQNGEFDVKSNISGTPPLSIDDGYETSRTNASDLTASTSSDMFKTTTNGLEIDEDRNRETHAKDSSKHRVKSLSNLHEILNLESEDERKKKEEQEHLERTKMEADEELSRGQKDIHNKLDSMLKARVKTMNASDRAFMKRQLKFPDPLLVNEPPLIIDREPSLELAESIERAAQVEMAEPVYARPYKGKDKVDGMQANCSEFSHKKIDASYNSQPSSAFPSRAPSFNSSGLENKRHSLVHLKDKETSELSKKESMLHELRHAMFKRSRPGSPTNMDLSDDRVDDNQQNIESINSTIQQHAQSRNTNFSKPINGFNNDFQQQNNNDNIDLYNSFPLPIHSNTPSRSPVAHEFKLEDEKLADEEPINKNAVVQMLKAHIKDKSGIESMKENKDLRFSRPKLTSNSFSMRSNDIEVDEPDTSPHRMAEGESQSLLVNSNVVNPTPAITVTEYMSPKHNRQEGDSGANCDVTKEMEMTVRQRASTFSEQTKEISETPMDDIPTTNQPRMNNFHQQNKQSDLPNDHFKQKNQGGFVSREESFSSQTAYQDQPTRVRTNTMTSQKNANFVSRKESFSSQITSQDQGMRTRTSSMTSQKNNQFVSREDSFSSQIASQDQGVRTRIRSNTMTSQDNGGTVTREKSFSSLASYKDQNSPMRTDSVVSQKADSLVSRNESFSSIYSSQDQPLNMHRNEQKSQNNRNSKILDSALRYETTKKSSEPLNYKDIIHASSSNNTADETINETKNKPETESKRQLPPAIAADSRGLDLSNREYYNPEDNNERVIKPSEFQVHRFADRNRRSHGNAIKKPEEIQHAVLKVQSDPSMDKKMSLNDLKKMRSQQRLKNSQKFSYSEPMLDTVIADSSSSMPLDVQLTSNDRTNETSTSSARNTRAKKVEKWSNEIYTNINVGKINIPDSFQGRQVENNTPNNAEDYNSEQEQRSDGKFNDRKHKREQQTTSNSSTPNESTPKKSKRRFSLTSLGSSGGSTSQRSDVTGTTTVPPSPSSARSKTSSRPASPSIGRRLKNMFSPRTKRKNKKATNQEMVDEDIMRRLNMNVNTNNNNEIYNNNNNSSVSTVTDGFSSIRSESGNSIVIDDDDDDFGLDDNFLSTEDWLNSHQTKSGHNNRRPNIKQAMIPVNGRDNRNGEIGSWKVRKNPGKVTVPEVFSSSTSSTIDNTQQSATNTKLNKTNGYHHQNSGIEIMNNDVVFTSFDVDE